MQLGVGRPLTPSSSSPGLLRVSGAGQFDASSPEAAEARPVAQGADGRGTAGV